MKTFNKKSLALITALAFLASCKSPMQSADEAKTASQAIKNYTQQTMEAMKGGAGLEVREDAYIRAQEHKDFNLKTDDTTVFFHAMSFQLTGTMEVNAIDLTYIKDKQKADSVRDFVKKMTPFLPNELEDEDLSALVKKNNEQTLYAFAATMHEINMTQVVNMKGQNAPHFKVVSFFDVITKSLALRPADLDGTIDRGNLSLADKEILREADKLIYILKLRYMILPVIALARMSHIQKGLITKLKMLYRPWDIRNDLGTEQINYLNDIFDRARTTKAFLNSIGEEVSLDPKVAKIYNNLKLDLGLSIVDSEAAPSPKDKALNGLLERINEVK